MKPTKYKDLLILKISEIAEWYNEKEMFIPRDMISTWIWEDWFYTCEFLGDGLHIFRRYHKDGSKLEEDGYKYELPHGKYIKWLRNGDKRFEKEYKDGHFHGKHIEYSYKIWKNGKLMDKFD